MLSELNQVFWCLCFIISRTDCSLNYPSLVDRFAFSPVEYNPSDEGANTQCRVSDTLVQPSSMYEYTLIIIYLARIVSLGQSMIVMCLQVYDTHKGE